MLHYLIVFINLTLTYYPYPNIFNRNSTVIIIQFIIYPRAMRFYSNKLCLNQNSRPIAGSFDLSVFNYQKLMLDIQSACECIGFRLYRKYINSCFQIAEIKLSYTGI